MNCHAHTSAQSHTIEDRILTQATIINQSSAVRLLRIANLDTILAATKHEASTNVVVVTTNTAWPREWCPPRSAIGSNSLSQSKLCHGCRRVQVSILCARQLCSSASQRQPRSSCMNRRLDSSLLFVRLLCAWSILKQSNLQSPTQKEAYRVESSRVVSKRRLV